jgi:hypothetical protein
MRFTGRRLSQAQVGVGVLTVAGALRVGRGSRSRRRGRPGRVRRPDPTPPHVLPVEHYVRPLEALQVTFSRDFGLCPLSGCTGVWKAKADVTRRSLGERSGQNGHLDIVVVVDLGGLLPGMGAEHAAGVLHEATLERDRTGKE